MHWQTGCSLGARYAIRIDLLRIDLLTEATRTERNVVFVSGQMSKLPSACFYFYLFASHKFFEIRHTWRGFKYCKYHMEEGTNIANIAWRMLQILQILRNWQFCKYLSLPNLISEWCTQLCDKQKSLRKLWPNFFGPSVPKYPNHTSCPLVH